MTAPALTSYAEHDPAISGNMLLAIPEDPKEPFGAPVLPRVDVPVSNRGLRLAHAAMMAHFSVTDEVAAKAKGGVAAQLTKAFAIVLDQARWEIHETFVVVRNEAGEEYHTTPGFCEGPAWYNPRTRSNTKACKGEMKANVSMCKHQLAIEYLRLAQELDPPIVALTDADPGASALAQIASIDLPGFALFSLLGCLNVKQMKVAAEQVDILISGGDDNFVCVSSGLYHAQAPGNPEGGAYIALEPDAFAILWKAVCTEGMKTPALTLTVTLDEQHNGALTVAGGTINVTVPIQGAAYEPT